VAARTVEHDDVLVTAVVPYGDDDLVVRLFGRARGRVGAFARKARASRRRFPGLSAPSLGRAAVQERHGSELLELKELDVDPALLALASDLRGFGHAAYVAELVERLLPEAEPAPEVFDLVSDALLSIARSGPSARLLRALELKLLLFLGYLPDLFDADAVHVEGGGLLDDARLAALALVQAPDLGHLPNVDDELLRPVSRIFASHLRRQGGPPLKSVQFLASL
jgi:recombinational DNA repair protein (RecF pathway)